MLFRSKAGHEMQQKFKVTGLDPIAGKFVIISVDAENTVIESDEMNNTAVRAFVVGE